LPLANLKVPTLVEVLTSWAIEKAEEKFSSAFLDLYQSIIVDF